MRIARMRLSALILCSLYCCSVSANEGSLVHELAAYEDTTQLQALLAENPNAWDTDDEYFGDSPAGIAIDAGNLAALKLFVANGYDLDPVDWFYHPVRMFSPYTGRDTPDHIEMMAWILSQIELRRDLDTTLKLLDFAEYGRLDAVKVLLEAGVDPNRWVMQWYSVWDLTDDAAVRELLESHGAKSNFRKLIAYAGIALLLLLVVLYFVFKTKPTKSEAGAAQRLSNGNRAILPAKNIYQGSVVRSTQCAGRFHRRRCGSGRIANSAEPEE